MFKIKNNNEWRVSQPPIGEEIVIFVNHVKPSYYVVNWNKDPDKKYYSDDWDIKLNSWIYVGPRNFEGGSQFLEDVVEKEFFWMPKENFVQKFGSKY